MNKVLALACASFFIIAASTTAYADEKMLKKGAKVFKKCTACHAIGPDAKNKIGVILNDIVGRKAASVEGFEYSPAMKAKAGEGLEWTEENLDKFITKPREFVPETKMAFAGVRKEKDRKAIIEFFKFMAENKCTWNYKEKKCTPN